MRCALWPDAAEADAVTWLLRKDAIIFVAELDPADGLIGFVEAGERAYADGCSTSLLRLLKVGTLRRNRGATALAQP